MVRRARDGCTWRIGTDAEVAWITEGTSIGRTITAAIPAVFEAYATVVVAYGEERVKHDRAVLALLAEQSPDQRWWLGYLDTGVDDIVFPEAPKVTLYAEWHYVLVEAGPEQAAAWRAAALRRGIVAVTVPGPTDVPREFWDQTRNSTSPSPASVQVSQLEA